MNASTFPVLQEAQWREEAALHLAIVREVTTPIRRRKERNERHPVMDFLFTYYSCSPGRLERWHPGAGIILAGARFTEGFTPRHYRQSSEGLLCDPSLLEQKGHDRLSWTLDLLRKTQERPPHLGCHGLHEWAMVYRGHDQHLRHRESAPLRLGQQGTDEVVRSLPLRCTHYDAYRFFTPEAAPLNHLRPQLFTRELNEQPGCVHANMDLYKWVYKSLPWVSSRLLRETLFLAIEAREVDMRASPYELTAYGYAPIKIETLEGRRQYQEAQFSLYRRGLTLRQKLIGELERVLALTS